MKKTSKQPHDGICGAKTRAGTPCKQKAGWGTNHVGTGRCKLHGGKSTGVKNNKNAVTTGERESIVFDSLEEDEKDLLNQIELNRLKQLDNEIKLTDIRLRRMMNRIAKLAKDDMTTIKTELKIDDFGPETKEIKQDTLSQIQNIEEAITRVQAQKLKLLKEGHNIEMDLGIDADLKEAQLEEIKAKIAGTYGADTSDNRTIHITNNIPNVIGESDD